MVGLLLSLKLKCWNNSIELNEVENLMHFAKRLDYIDDEAVKEIEEDVAKTRKPIFGFMKHIREKYGIDD